MLPDDLKTSKIGCYSTSSSRFLHFHIALAIIFKSATASDCSQRWGAVGELGNGLCLAVTLRVAAFFYLPISHRLPIPIALPGCLFTGLGAVGVL